LEDSVRAGHRIQSLTRVHLDSTFELEAAVEAWGSKFPWLEIARNVATVDRHLRARILGQDDEPTPVLLRFGWSDVQCTEGHEGCGKQGLVASGVALVIVVLDLAGRLPGSMRSLKNESSCRAGLEPRP